MSASNHGDSVKAILYAFLANLGLLSLKQELLCIPVPVV